MTDPVPHFDTPDAVSGYARNARRMVPGLGDLHRMTLLLLAEDALPKDTPPMDTPPGARVLVVGAGGGMELAAFAQGQPDWRFDGVDPAPAMLALARDTLGPLMDRVRLHEGYVDRAPDGPFDAASCLLTLHFLSREDRLHTLRQIRRRLKPGAPFVMAHHSVEQDPKARARWARRFAAFGTPPGAPRVSTLPDDPGIFGKLPVLSPDQEEALLREAGFHGVALFYAAFTFRGWVAYA